MQKGRWRTIFSKDKSFGVRPFSVKARRKAAERAKVSENWMRQGSAPAVRNPFSRCDLQMSPSKRWYFW
jgi:acetyl-CoA acetyltransferase